LQQTSTFCIRQGALVLFVILEQRGGDAHKVRHDQGLKNPLKKRKKEILEFVSFFLVLLFSQYP
jgi:hypothetical protein